MFTQIGPTAIWRGNRELVITIAHEEMHHRIAQGTSGMEQENKTEMKILGVMSKDELVLAGCRRESIETISPTIK